MDVLDVQAVDLIEGLPEDKKQIALKITRLLSSCQSVEELQEAGEQLLSSQGYCVQKHARLQEPHRLK